MHGSSSTLVFLYLLGQTEENVARTAIFMIVLMDRTMAVRWITQSMAKMMLLMWLSVKSQTALYVAFEFRLSTRHLAFVGKISWEGEMVACVSNGYCSKSNPYVRKCPPRILSDNHTQPWKKSMVSWAIVGIEREEDEIRSGYVW